MLERDECDLLKPVLGKVQADLVAARNQLQQNKDPATLITEVTKYLEKLEKERGDLDNKYQKAEEAMDQAEDHWRKLGTQLADKDAKIKVQKERVQEAFNRRAGQDSSQIDVVSMQSMCTVMADIARTSADQGLCRNE